MTRRTSTMTSTRHPATIGIFAATTLAGCWGVLVPGGQSSAIDAAFPNPFVPWYYAIIAVGGALALSAMAIPDLDRRVRAERAAWYVPGWFSLSYSLSAFLSVGVSAGQAAIVIGSISPIATYRIVQITLQRRRTAHDRDTGMPASPSPLGVADEGTA